MCGRTCHQIRRALNMLQPNATQCNPNQRETLNMQHNAPAASHMLQTRPPPIWKYESTYLPRPHILSLKELGYSWTALDSVRHAGTLCNEKCNQPFFSGAGHLRGLHSLSAQWRKSKGLQLEVRSWRATKFLFVNMDFDTPHILALWENKNFTHKAKQGRKGFFEVHMCGNLSTEAALQ